MHIYNNMIFHTLLKCITVLFIFININQALSQEPPSLLLTDITAEKGDTIVVPVTVKDFETIAAFTFSLEWDTLILKYVTVEQLYFNDIDFSDSVKHNIGVLWSATNISIGESISDNSILFSMKFEVITDENVTSEIKFTNEPSAILFVKADADFTEIVPTYNSGMITVQRNSTPTKNTNRANFFLYQNQPNPFLTQTSISFDLFESDTVKMDIFNTSGKKIFSLKRSFPAGKNNFALERSSFSNTGLYYYTITTSKYQQTKKLVVF